MVSGPMTETHVWLERGDLALNEYPEGFDAIPVLYRADMVPENRVMSAPISEASANLPTNGRLQPQRRSSLSLA